VVGTDEAFFEDDDAATIRDLYTEKQGVLDDNDDEVDLASYAWQIWKQATAGQPRPGRAVESLPPVVYSAKTFQLDESRFPLAGRRCSQWRRAGVRQVPRGQRPPGLGGRQRQDRDRIAIHRAARVAECEPDTPAVPRLRAPPRSGGHRPATGREPGQGRGRWPGPPQQPAPAHLRAPQALRHRTDENPVPRRRAGARPGRHVPAPAAGNRSRPAQPPDAQRRERRPSWPRP
jgi:hypothetical protein